jgi:hypothetical protein
MEPPNPTIFSTPGEVEDRDYKSYLDTIFRSFQIDGIGAIP